MPASAKRKTAIAAASAGRLRPSPAKSSSVAPVCRALDQTDDAKRAKVHHGIGRQIDEQRCVRLLRGDGNGDQHVARIRHARIRQHALHVALRDRQQIAADHRQHGNAQKIGCHCPVSG